MSMMTTLFGETFKTQCTVDIQNTFENLCAHVELDGNPALHPGDTVKVHGDPVQVPYGECLMLRRDATVHRANPLERLWGHIRGDLEIFEMFEVSFTSGRPL